MNPVSLSGNPFDYVIVFVGGALMSFTPCVYPLIPITVGFIGAGSYGSRLKGLFLSLVYVLGMAVTYSLLGIAASLTGTIFGKLSYAPSVNLFVGCVVIIFGLGMLDLFNMPGVSINIFPGAKKRGYLSTFILGITSGLVASPCITPVLGSILLYVSAKKNLLYGGTLLFTFAFGMGLLLIIVGTGSSILINLPKAGKWMGYIKRTYAAILICAGAYFIYTAVTLL